MPPYRQRKETSLTHARELLQAIKDYANLFQAIKDNTNVLQAIRDDTRVLQAHIPGIQSNLKAIQHNQESTTHHALLQWLSPTDYPAQPSNIIKSRQEGTGKWFLAAPEWSQWLDEAKATLFCPGIPGAGKTMIAAIAIDRLLELAQNKSHGVVYVYCDYLVQKEQDASSMLRAIVKQLVQGRYSARQSIEKLHERDAHKGTNTSPDEIYSALRDVVERYSYVHIVVDALDECHGAAHHQLLTKLDGLQAEYDLRLMATSRFIPEIEDKFRGALRLEVQASEQDVRRFVASQIYRLPACIQRNATLQEIVQDGISKAVYGM